MTAKDITGQRFHQLTVLHRIENNRHQNAVWLCLCTCGQTKAVRGDALRSGTIKSCGCLHAFDLTGRKFNKLTAVKLVGYNKHKFRLWECLCDCGNTVLVPSGTLLQAKQKSCGCIRRDVAIATGKARRKDLGQRIRDRSKVNVETGCWDWQGFKDLAGYGSIEIPLSGSSRTLRAHRASFVHFNGVSLESIEGLVVCHKCDNPSCVNPAHLFLGTQRDNVLDSVRKGRRDKIKSRQTLHSPA